MAAVIDLFSRRVVGWSMSAAMTAHLAPPLVADLAKVMELYQNDLSDAASIWSS